MLLRSDKFCSVRQWERQPDHQSDDTAARETDHRRLCEIPDRIAPSTHPVVVQDRQALVIHRSLLWRLEYLVCGDDLLQLLLCRRITRVEVRVKSLGGPPKRHPDRFVAGTARHAKDFIGRHNFVLSDTPPAGFAPSLHKMLYWSRSQTQRATPVTYLERGCQARRVKRALGGDLLRRSPRLPHIEHITVASLGDAPDPWPRKVRAADHHVVRDHSVHQLTARGFRHWTILVVGPVPAWIRPEQRRHVDGIAGDHQLVVARAQVESRVTGRMAGRR